MINLFNNLHLTPSCAVHKSEEWVLVGKNLVETYKALLEDPQYNSFDDKLTIGTFMDCYDDTKQFIESLPELLNRSDVNKSTQVIVDQENFWPIYVSVLKTILPNLDANTLYVIMTCVWYHLTYVEPGFERGIKISGTLDDVVSWISKPTLVESTQLLKSCSVIENIEIEKSTLPWEFQVAKMLTSNAPEIKQRAGRMVKGFFFDISVSDRYQTLLKNLPDFDKLTGKRYDYEQEIMSYLEEFDNFASLFEESVDTNVNKKLDEYPNEKLVERLNDFINNHIPNHYDIVKDYVKTFTNLPHTIDWSDYYIHLDGNENEQTGKPNNDMYFCLSNRYNFCGPVIPSLMIYIFKNKNDKGAISKFVPI